MQSKKRSYMPLTAFMMSILISMLMSVTACSSGEKTESARLSLPAAPFPGGVRRGEELSKKIKTARRQRKMKNNV